MFTRNGRFLFSVLFQLFDDEFRHTLCRVTVAGGELTASELLGSRIYSTVSRCPDGAQQLIEALHSLARQVCRIPQIEIAGIVFDIGAVEHNRYIHQNSIKHNGGIVGYEHVGNAQKLI